jgi:hypothetical protein
MLEALDNDIGKHLDFVLDQSMSVSSNRFGTSITNDGAV